jgi:hypothetical protein
MASLPGIVVDPQNLPVPGARVELVCGAHRDTADSDQSGRFTIAAPDALRGCRLLVTRHGFAPFERRVDARDDVGRISLRIADVAQQVSVVAEPLSSRSIGSVVLAESDLRMFAGTTADLVRYVRLLAGGTMQPGAIYVDGLPAAALPPLHLVASISVNADPFSAERSDGDVASIEILTRAPSRKLTFHAGSDVLGIGGVNALAPDSRSASAFQNVGMAGPVPRVPVTFVAGVSFGGTSADVPIRAVIPGGDTAAETAESRSRTWSGTLSAYWSPKAPFKVRVSWRESHADSENLGAGGIVLPEAGSSASFMTRDARAAVTGMAARWQYEGSLVVGQSRWSSTANSSGAGIMIRGDVVMGGASVIAARTRHTGWTTAHVLRGTSRTPWVGGVTMSGVTDSDAQTPNAAGLFEFADLASYTRALAGGGTATWFVTRGNGLAQRGNIRVATFAQKQLLAARHLELAAGARADYQSGLGTVLSPRLSLAANWRGATVRAGAGLFVKDVPNTIFVIALKNDGRHLQQFMTMDAPLDGSSGTSLPPRQSIHSGIAPGLTAPREWMSRVSVERRIGGVVPGIEYTWTLGRHMLGSERSAGGSGWLDVFESDRAAERHRVRAQLLYAKQGRQLSAQYEWTHARDNTDGPFSFAAQAGSPAAEWARSTGVPPHNVSVTASSMLLAGVSLNVMYTWRSSAPCNITSGVDAARNGLFLDRGGRARNSGHGPGYSSLDLYAYRRVKVPNLLRSANRQLHLNIGVQAQNLLDRRNVMSVGSVVGAANFGRPISAYPGRSIRLSVSLD